jgi:hypothetical protein
MYNVIFALYTDILFQHAESFVNFSFPDHSVFHFGQCCLAVRPCPIFFQVLMFP